MTLLAGAAAGGAGQARLQRKWLPCACLNYGEKKQQVSKEGTLVQRGKQSRWTERNQDATKRNLLIQILILNPKGSRYCFYILQSCDVSLESLSSVECVFVTYSQRVLTGAQILSTKQWSPVLAPVGTFCPRAKYIKEKREGTEWVDTLQFVMTLV